MPNPTHARDGRAYPDDALLSVGLRPDFAAYDFALPVSPWLPAAHAATAELYRLSETTTLRMWRSESVSTRKCIYPRLPLSPHDEAREYHFLAWAQNETAVQALGRIVPQRYCARVAASDESMRCLVPDFLVRTPDATYLVDVHARDNPSQRLRAMMGWCEWANALPLEHRGERAWFFAPLSGLPLRDWRRSGGQLCEQLAIARVHEGYVAHSGVG